jgi:L-ascorbate metabolism protein UlaG (beta-lactamase superfamily)
VHHVYLPADGSETPDDSGSVLFIGTATVLIRYAGLTILTDPNFLHRGDKVHLGYGLHATRRTDPALDLEDLPPVDLVLLSHLHEDHFDRLVAERLDKRIPIVTTGHAAVELKGKGFSALHALSTWEALEVRKGPTTLRVTSMPGRHGPLLLSKLLPPVMGSILDFSTPRRRHRIYVSGDTMVFDQLREIPRRFGDIDLALLHLGGTRVVGVTVTMDGDDGVRAMKIVDPKLAIPIHYDDYDVFKSGLDDFRRAVERAGLGDRVEYLARGESHTFRPRPVAGGPAVRTGDTPRPSAPSVF